MSTTLPEKPGRLSSKLDVFGSLSTTAVHHTEPGCKDPPKFLKTFREVKPTDFAPPDTQTAKRNNQVTKETIASTDDIHPKTYGCKYMADDIVIETLEREKRRQKTELQTEHDPEIQEAEETRREKKEKGKVVNHGRAEERYGNSLMANSPSVEYAFLSE
jgi:hypothetical protein